MPRRPKLPKGQRYWTAAEAALIGTASDAAVAKQLKRTYASVYEARLLRKIPAFRKLKLWSASEIEQLGTASDSVVAKRLGRKRNDVAIKRWHLGIPSRYQPRRSAMKAISWGPTELAMFKNFTDAEIAKATCRPLAVVQAKRAELTRGQLGLGRNCRTSAARFTRSATTAMKQFTRT